VNVPPVAGRSPGRIWSDKRNVGGGSVAGLVMLETSMTNNAEGASEDLAADLAAVRREVARLADTLSKLVHYPARRRLRGRRGLR
jgi:hypothetical protein